MSVYNWNNNNNRNNDSIIKYAIRVLAGMALINGNLQVAGLLLMFAEVFNYMENR
jgi:hypothetical protein